MKNVLFVLIIFFLGIGPEPAKAVEPSAQRNTSVVLSKAYTGDLPELQKRRLIRVLTSYNKTSYFVDKGQPRGLVYDAMKEFESEINKKLKTGNSASCCFYPCPPR